MGLLAALAVALAAATPFGVHCRGRGRSPAPCTGPIFFRDARFSVLTPHAIRIERHPGCGGGARCEFDNLPSTAFTER